MKYWKNIAKNIWEYESEIRMIGGIWFSIRSTLIRLKSGKLWLHSPCNFPDDAIKEIKQLGEVAYIIGPNAFHHLYLGKSAFAFPDAQLWSGPKVTKKQKNLSFEGLLHADVPWADEIQTLPLQGIRFLEESVFFHMASKTFICTDFVFNVHDYKNFRTQLLVKLIGADKKLAQGREVKMLVKDRRLLSQDIKKISTWDFERIVMAHGEILESKDVRQRLSNATAWITKGEPDLLIKE